MKMPSAGQFPAGHAESDDDFTDEETPLQGNEIYGGSRRSVVETKAWDSFRNLPPESTSLSEDSSQYVSIIVKGLKVFTYLVTFLVVLGGGVFTKALVFLMTSQLRSKNVTLCALNYKLEDGPEYMSTIPTQESVAWAWAIYIAYMVPELGTWIRSTRMCLFKSWKKPQASDFFTVFIFETLHVMGVGLLAFAVFPNLDVVRGAMLTNCVAFIPGLLGLLSRNKKESKLMLKVCVDLAAILFQLSGFFMCIIWQNPDDTTYDHSLYLIPVSVFLTSFGWWENYVDRQSGFSFISWLGKVKERLWRSRYFCYIFISLWKCMVFFGIMAGCMTFSLGNTDIFNVANLFSKHQINVTEVHQTLDSNVISDVDTITQQAVGSPIESTEKAQVYVFLLQILGAYLCYVFGKFACKICIQGFSFAFAVNLTIPTTISLLIFFCGMRAGDECWSTETFGMPGYLFWDCNNDVLSKFLKDYSSWIWLFWLLSQTWITLHIWAPKCERLASTEKLFVRPMYDSLLVDQSLALNRRRDDDAEVKTDELNLNPEATDAENQYYECISDNTDSSNTNSKARNSDSITRIFATATMWHETQEEMMEMLKSIFRMDEDQSARRITQKYLEVVDLDYYEFETHIFFDDSFEVSDDNEDEHVVNNFVKLLVSLIDEAATHVHQINIRIRPPKKFPTPYGGRLVWTLPGKTKIICHLKDKDKIRHKKRWSQVMYMYYLLGFKLMEQPLPVDRKEVLAENTYLLTLDGDIDFAPKAVALLVDLMKKNTNLGAACGRIHPVGSGMMVWYQMFEYAIGHWLQKATEHMIGCVLCSPGCFSLFRGKALMDDNVMAKYTTKSTQARHYVQYDQGEDRWLCTLLLQRGYRVEYSAASDAYTHCPEGFGEFYNQRRRWVPSTMANIMDLLQDYKKTIHINDNISLPYIGYQTMLMGGTILGPGTIFLMLVGAFVAAFKIGNWPSFQYNIIPIIVFMIVCFTMKSSNQVIVAQMMSAGYALIMMAVIVGTTLQLHEDGIGSPSFIFLVSLSGSFFIAACMHPQEFRCIIPGILYLLAIPSMYLLLIIYSLINLNNVSWGTREVVTKKTKKEQEAERKAQEEAKKKQKAEGLLGFLYRNESTEDEGSIEFSLAGLFKIMCCVHPKPDERKHIAEAIDEIKKMVNDIQQNIGIAPHSGRRSSMQPRRTVRQDHLNIHSPNEGDFDDESSDHSAPKEERDDLVNPFWMEDKAMKRGEVDYLPSVEIQFFKDLIEKYLYPLNKNAKEQVLITKEYLQLEPIGLVFVFFFALILLIQFVAMLFHRFGTFSHILASTEITYCNKKAEDATEEGKLERDALELVRNLQRLKGADGDYEPKTQATDRRKTIANIEAHRKKKPAIGTLDVAFKKRFFSISNDNEASPIVNDRRLSKRRETLRALAQRRDNVVEERRKSRILTMDSRRHNRTRTSIASDADNQRVFTPNGAANEGFENDNEIYGDPMINRSLGRYSKKPEENINYVP